MANLRTLTLPRLLLAWVAWCALECGLVLAVVAVLFTLVCAAGWLDGTFYAGQVAALVPMFLALAWLLHRVDDRSHAVGVELAERMVDGLR